MKNCVFLGGTWNNSTWREKLIPLLKIDYFNPIVDDWTEECYQKELEERENDRFLLYCITPKMTGVYSIAEAVDDSNKRPNRVIFVYLENDENKTFEPSQLKSIKKVGEMIKNNGGYVFYSLKECADFINSKITFKGFFENE